MSSYPVTVQNNTTTHKIEGGENDGLMDVDDWYLCVKDEHNELPLILDLPAYVSLWAGEKCLFYSKNILEKSLFKQYGELVITNAFIRLFENGAEKVRIGIMEVFEINVNKIPESTINESKLEKSRNENNNNNNNNNNESTDNIYYSYYGNHNNNGNNNIIRNEKRNSKNKLSRENLDLNNFEEDRENQVIVNIPAVDITENDEILEIKCKNFRILQIQFEKAVDLESANYILEKKCFCEIRECFAYSNREYEIFKFGDRCIRGWDLYNFADEFSRQNVSSSWNLTSLNSSFQLCPTYPPFFYVPSSISDLELQQMSKFRSSARLAALSYFYSANGATISRASQPHVGLLWSRSEADEKFVKEIGRANKGEAEKKVKVIDCRSRVAALANQAKRGGTESLQYYENIELKFLKIGNIHVMRDTHFDLFNSYSARVSLSSSPSGSASPLFSSSQISPRGSTVATPIPSFSSSISPSPSSSSSSSTTTSSFSSSHLPQPQQQSCLSSSVNSLLLLSPVAPTGKASLATSTKKRVSNGISASWKHHIYTILSSGDLIATYVKDGFSVLIHCSDGWDRTPQVSSVAQILLDPYYRTFLGFECLVEKEWVSFGHKFADRTGHGKRGYWKQHECSPVFLQFLDCVFQLMCKNRRAFQFNELFLEELMECVYNCNFGNFLHNNMRERDEDNVKGKTQSVWGYLNQAVNIKKFKNEEYSDVEGNAPLHSEIQLDEIEAWSFYSPNSSTAEDYPEGDEDIPEMRLSDDDENEEIPIMQLQDGVPGEYNENEFITNHSKGEENTELDHNNSNSSKQNAPWGTIGSFFKFSQFNWLKK